MGSVFTHLGTICLGISTWMFGMVRGTWLCSALLCARGHSSCVLADDFSLTSIRRTVWVVHSRGSLFTSEDAEGGLMTVGQEGVLWPMHPHSKQMDDIPSY